MVGAFSIYTQEIADEITERLSLGETLEEICRDEHMPGSRTVHSWTLGAVKSVPASFAADIALARACGYDVIAQRTRETARGHGDSTADVVRDKLIIDTDLKLLAKWSKKYSDRVTTEVTGADGEPLFTEDDRAKRLTALLARIADNSQPTEPTDASDLA